MTITLVCGSQFINKPVKSGATQIIVKKKMTIIIELDELRAAVDALTKIVLNASQDEVLPIKKILVQLIDKL